MNMKVVSGRVRHDAKRRSQQVLRTNGPGLAVAEVLAGVVHDAVERRDRRRLLAAAREAWGVLREEPFPYGAAELRTAADRLDDAGSRWARLGAEEPLELEWPRALRPGARRRQRV